MNAACPTLWCWFLLMRSTTWGAPSSAVFGGSDDLCDSWVDLVFTKATPMRGNLRRIRGGRNLVEFTEEGHNKNHNWESSDILLPHPPKIAEDGAPTA
jgi:hypothetical protein